jgi:hypothetical protein
VSAVTNTGGAAFPYYLHRTGGKYEPGMTLRDYFIAHAPAEPQPWFEPTMPHPKPEAPAWPAFTDDEHAQYNSWRNGGREVEEIESVQVASFARQTIFYANQREDWEHDYQKQRLVQWPAAWADEMLKARQL